MSMRAYGRDVLFGVLLACGVAVVTAVRWGCN